MTDPHIDLLRICSDCGSDKNYYAKELCQKCYMKLDQRRFRANNPEKDKARKRKWYLENKVKVAFIRKRSRILKHYNLTLEELKSMGKMQNNKCLICEEKLPLKIDHDHETGLIRGLLCDLCNRGLGYFKDKPELLVKAARYILDNKPREEEKWL